MTVVGLPADFAITEERAQSLDIDVVVEGQSLEHGVYGVHTALGAAAKVAYEAEDRPIPDALQLLTAVTSCGQPEGGRGAFTPMASGTLNNDGSPWRTCVPDDLTEAHVAILELLFADIRTPVLRARIADVLLTRRRPRDVTFAREPVRAYLQVAHLTFDPEHWPTSFAQIARAYHLAHSLGRANAEAAEVVATAFAFLERLDGDDPLYFTERLISLVSSAELDLSQARSLLSRAMRIVTDAESQGNYDRARAYYDAAIPLAQRIDGLEAAKTLRLRRAETYVAQAELRPTEMLRAFDLRLGMQALRRAGASRARRDEVARLLDDAQTVAVTEMASRRGRRCRGPSEPP